MARRTPGFVRDAEQAAELTPTEEDPAPVHIRPARSSFTEPEEATG